MVTGNKKDAHPLPNLKSEALEIQPHQVQFPAQAQQVNTEQAKTHNSASSAGDTRYSPETEGMPVKDLKKKTLSSKKQKSKTRNKSAGTNNTVLFTLSNIAKQITRTIRRIWATADRIDSAIWQVLAKAYRNFANVVTLITDWIIDGFILFLKWIPTRTGQSYCALFGVVVIITGLWITDELRGAELSLRAAQAGTSETIPIDSDDPVMARIGGEYIYLSEVEAAARNAGTLQAEEQLDLDSEFTRELVSTFVDQRLLAEAAEKNNLENENLLQARLRAARDRILAAAHIDQVLAEKVTDEQVTNLYRAQADLTSLGEELRIRHILIDSRSEAVSIINTLEEGADFATMARGRSLDRGTAIHGGDTGYITRDMVSEEFGRIAFAIDEGAVSPPFRTSDGWNIIKVLEKRKTESIAFDSVEENLRRFLTLKAIDETLTGLKQDNEVVIYDHDNDQTEKDDVLKPPTQ